MKQREQLLSALFVPFPCAEHVGLKRFAMLLVLALVLLVTWILGFVVFHIAGFLIHILILLAIVSAIFYFLRGRAA